MYLATQNELRFMPGHLIQILAIQLVCSCETCICCLVVMCVYFIHNGSICTTSRLSALVVLTRTVSLTEILRRLQLSECWMG